jgi:hypothetical protein
MFEMFDVEIYETDDGHVGIKQRMAGGEDDPVVILSVAQIPAFVDFLTQAAERIKKNQ